MKTKMTKQKKASMISSITTVVIIVCLVLVNVISYYVSENHQMKIDLTSNKAFQLTEESVNYISGINKPISIKVLNTKSGFAYGNNYFEQATSVIEQYSKYNENINVEFIDYMANPTIAQEYNDIEAQINDIIIECGENRQKLTVYDLFNIEQSWYGSSITASIAEQAMTSAIMNVSTDNKPVITIANGHEEVVYTAFEDILSKNGFKVNTIQLQTEEIPEDTEVLISIAPKRDFSEEVIAKLDNYMKEANERNKSMLYFASSQQGETPNIEKWLNKWGISVGNGMVAETSQNRVVGNNAFYGVADIVDKSVTMNMTAIDIPFIVPFTRPVAPLFKNNMGYTTEILLSYSQTSGIADESVEKFEDIVVSGPNSVACKSTKDNTNLFVFGTDLLLEERNLGNNSISNLDYTLSLFNTITEKENAIIIAPKTLGGGTFAIVQSQALIYAAILVVLLPLAVVILGITIWVKRKRR